MKAFGNIWKRPESAYVEWGLCVIAGVLLAKRFSRS